MSKVFFDELKLDSPDIYLDAKGATQIELMADIMVKFEKELQHYQPDLISIPLKGQESGFFDRTMPEEINRILIDDLSDFFFVTEQSGIDHLKKENKSEEQIHFVGNTMIDSLVEFRSHIEKSTILDEIKSPSFHRPSNVDHLDTLKELVKTIQLCSNYIAVVLPLHPRTKKSLQKHFGVILSKFLI